MRRKADNIANCLEDRIIHLAETELFSSDLTIVQEMKENIKNLRAAYAGIYWDIYNKPDLCRGPCGTTYHLFHHGKYNALLEGILLDINWQIARYEAPLE